MDNLSLDFSKLFEQEKTPSKKPVEPFYGDNASNLSSQKEKPATGQIGGLTGASVFWLEKRAKKEQRDREEAAIACREHIVNTAKSQLLQSEILKGLKAGADIYALFLKAAKAVSLMTNNSLFYTQAEKDLIAIYGIGLQEKPPLSIELEAVEGRLQRLREAEGRETDPDSRERIRRAVIAHKARAEELGGLLLKGSSQPCPNSPQPIPNK